MAQGAENGLMGIDVGIFIVAGDGLVFVDRRMAEMLGREKGQVPGLRLEAVVTDEDLPSLVEAFAELRTAGESSIVTHLQRGSGAALEVEMHIWKCEIGDQPMVVGLARDLEALRESETQRARLHRQIEQAAQEWRMTFDVVETPIIIIGADGSVRRINRAARIASGKSYEEIINHSAANLGTDEPWPTIRELTRVVLDQNSLQTSQVSLGDGRTWDVLAIPFLVPGGAEQRVLIAVWDVTQVVELQSSLDNARSMAEIGALVAGVAHEVRNPLFAVSATLDALHQASEGRYEEHFEILNEQIARMAKLMQHLLDYGRPSHPRFSYDDQIEYTVDLALESYAQQAAASGVTIEKIVESEPPTLFFDPERIGRALENVIHNAILHSPEGGRVSIRLVRSDENHQRWLLVRVEDEGPGFPLEAIDRVFEPFFTKRKGGTGLGLSMVRQIVEEHGGKVAVENRPSGGAAVVIRLPVQSEPGDGDGGFDAEK
jgi:PAS domain S-box-containing protein